jgi:hypothetical protein
VRHLLQKLKKFKNIDSLILFAFGYHASRSAMQGGPRLREQQSPRLCRGMAPARLLD